MQILNKITNEKLNVELSAYPSAKYKDYAVVPPELYGKDTEWNEEAQAVVEKPISLDEKKAAALALIAAKQKTPFDVTITDIDGVEGSYFVDLQDATILRLLVLLTKAQVAGQASDEFINALTGVPEYKTFSATAIQQVQADVIAKDDLYRLKANQVKLAATITEVDNIISGLE